jgi:hypothetical protein
MSNVESSKNIAKTITRKHKDNKDSNIVEDGKKNASMHENKTMKKTISNQIKTIHEDEKFLNISTEIDDEDSNNNNDKNIELNGEIIDPNINYEKQYDLDNDIIEKELNFYDFDEELLQYRPIEINNLIQSLLNLKSALILTSTENEVENIIDYSNSEYIFNDFKNKEGSRMCQSNIGIYKVNS